MLVKVGQSSLVGAIVVAVDAAEVMVSCREDDDVAGLLIEL